MTRMMPSPSFSSPLTNPLSHTRAWCAHPRAPHGPPHPARDATSRRATASGCLILVGVLVCSALVFSGGRWETAIAQETVLAVIGDYRVPGEPEADVANLVRSWNPDVVITTGDNCYDPGDYPSNVDPYYGDFVAAGQFLPAIGNHDRDDCGGLEAYAAYFNVPRYYEVASGAVHIFILNSEPDEPDGVTSDSPQAEWVRNALAASTAPWKIVVAHRPPYSSGAEHGSQSDLQWPFKDWGASVVIAGDDHLFERVLVDDLPYFVIGLGGAPIHPFGPPIEGSVVRYNADDGAMRIEADASAMTLSFYTRFGALIDAYTLGAGAPSGVRLIAEHSEWKYLDDGSNQGMSWTSLDFDDSAWASGHAELGYGDGDEATVVSYGPAADFKYITTYFRKSFDVEDPAAFSTLLLDIVFDDGAIVYLNGSEIFRANMPASADFTMLALAAIAGVDEGVWHAASVDPSLLRAGTNILAVEIHQADVGSSDISFHLTLTGVGGVL